MCQSDGAYALPIHALSCIRLQGNSFDLICFMIAETCHAVRGDTSRRHEKMWCIEATHLRFIETTHLRFIETTLLRFIEVRDFVGGLVRASLIRFLEVTRA